MAEKKEEFSLLAYLDDLVEKLRDQSARAITDGNVDSVHDARVATRRLKAALDLIKPAVTKDHRQPLVKIIRLLRRRLGELRDLDVMLSHLPTMKAAALQPAVQWITERLQKARKKAMAKAGGDLPAPRVLAKLGNWWGLRQEIVPAQEAVGSFLAESVHLQLDAFAEEATRLTQKVPGRDPHQLRIAGKSLRYTLELAKAHGVRLRRSVLSDFRRIQTALGLWHDYVVLSERVLGDSAKQQLAFHDPERQQAVLSLAAAALRRSQQQLAKVAEFWTRDGPALVNEIRESFPLTVPAEAPALTPPATPEPTPDPHTMPPSPAAGADGV